MNLYKETIEILKEHGKTFDDVVVICGDDFQITKDDFIKYSNTEYDSGYGAPEVAEDLLVIGAGFWLERHEYDGSEWWEYKEIPERNELPFRKINALTVRQAYKIGWETLESLNAETEIYAE